jgi:hypothetical protein
MTDTTVPATPAAPASAVENTGFKGLLVTLFQRVVLSYKSTLIGIGVAGVGAVVDYYANSPNKMVTMICGIVGGALALIKEQGIVKVPPPAP